MRLLRAWIPAVQHEENPGEPQHIADLVRIGNNCRNSARYYGTSELPRRHHRALDVDMRIQETRGNEALLQIHHLARVVTDSKAGDHVASDGDVRGVYLARENIDSRAFAQEVCRAIASGDGEDVRSVHEERIYHPATLTIPGS